jgi:hypothetical protein
VKMKSSTKSEEKKSQKIPHKKAATAALPSRAAPAGPTTRENFVGQPLKVELYEKKLKPIVGSQSKKAGRRLHLSWRRFI